MRPLPNDLAQGLLRLLQRDVLPGLSGQAAATAARIAAILRDTDWNRAQEIAGVETALLDRALDLLGLPVPTAAHDMAGLSARIAAQRSAIAQAVAAGPDARLRRALAEVLANCAELGLGQQSAPQPGQTHQGESVDARGRAGSGS